jgi:hypothetical protein
MDNAFFVFNNKRHYIGTIVSVKQHKKNMFGYNSTVRFVQYNRNNNLYYFASLYDIFDRHGIPEYQLQDCIENVLTSCDMNNNTSNKLDPKYIDGIVNAWCWYILIMFFAFFLEGIGNQIITWTFSSFVFFNWRNKKINGG